MPRCLSIYLVLAGISIRRRIKRLTRTHTHTRTSHTELRKRVGEIPNKNHNNNNAEGGGKIAPVNWQFRAETFCLYVCVGVQIVRSLYSHLHLQYESTDHTKNDLFQRSTFMVAPIIFKVCYFGVESRVSTLLVLVYAMNVHRALLDMVAGNKN